jgi:hypothetical protein
MHTHIHICMAASAFHRLYVRLYVALVTSSSLCECVDDRSEALHEYARESWGERCANLARNMRDVFAPNTYRLAADIPPYFRHTRFPQDYPTIFFLIRRCFAVCFAWCLTLSSGQQSAGSQGCLPSSRCLVKGISNRSPCQAVRRCLSVCMYVCIPNSIS